RLMTLDRLLIVKLADIGDVLTATPALRALRQTFPSVRLDLLTTPAAAAAAAAPPSLVDRVWTAPRSLARSPGELPGLWRLLAGLRRQRYNAVLYLHHLTLGVGVVKYRLLAAATGAPLLLGLDNGKGGWLSHSAPDQGFGAVHEVEYWLQVVALLGAQTSSQALHPSYSDADARAVEPLLAERRPQPLVAIHPGSGGYAPARRWEPAKWAGVADELVRRYGAQIVLVGTLADGAAAVQAAMSTPALNLAGRTTLPQLAAVLAQCDLFLGADSGVMHVAASVAVPLVALFGPSNHLAWGPWAAEAPAAVVRLGLRCSPCSYVDHSVGARDGCWHRSCMADLQPERVLAAVEALGVLDVISDR
ncbi:MAG TPA: glycosyltransferase family 9 protein, partial [Anaerolineae bacterium]|nr:glycosyltransferase family 9 protein [Anaerolineae bacterium]